VGAPPRYYYYNTAIIVGWENRSRPNLKTKDAKQEKSGDLSSTSEIFVKSTQIYQIT